MAWPGPAVGGLRRVIILDTNVLSALMRTKPDPPVVAWLDRQPPESIWITSITLFEAHLGLRLLPRGARQRALDALVHVGRSGDGRKAGSIGWGGHGGRLALSCKAQL